MNNLDPTTFRRIAIFGSNPNQILTLLNTVTNTIVQHPTGITLIIKLTHLIRFYETREYICDNYRSHHLNNAVDHHLFGN